MSPCARVTMGGIVIALVGASLSACGGAEAIDAGDATVLVSERRGDAMDALLEGTLAVVDGCLGITGADYHDMVVVWPHGTKVVSDDPATIDIPGIGTVAVGEGVSIGGGVDRSDGSVGGATVPAYCDEGEIWLAH